MQLVKNTFDITIPTVTVCQKVACRVVGVESKPELNGALGTAGLQ